MAQHDEFKLRQALAARARGDDVAARRWWSELVTDNFDRISGLVVAIGFGKGLLRSDDERQEALQRALVAIELDMFENFAGTTVGEWVTYAKRVVWGKCVDVLREAVRRGDHEGRLDEVDTEGQETGRIDPAVYAIIRDRESQDEADELDRELHDLGRDFLEWAMPRLTEGRRLVLELDREGVPVEEMQERLGKGRDAIYQARHRGMQDLDTLRKEYES